MKVRSVLFASVCAALLAASAAVPAAAAAAAKSLAATASENAYKALVSGRFAEAIKLFGEAIESRELGPDLLANSLLNRALAFQNVGQHQDAIDDYSAALRVDALSAKLRAVALYNRGLAFQKVKRPAMAIEDFTSALFLDVEFSHAYYSRGNVLRRNGQFLFALSDYEKSLKYSHPEPHLPLYGIALTYESLRRPHEAQKALVQALTLKPDFMAARQKLSSLIRLQPANAEMPTHKATAQQASASDTIVTGSVLSNNPDLVMRKKELPIAVSPPNSVQQAVKVVPASVNHNEPAETQTAELPKAEEADPAPAETAVSHPPLTGWTVQISSQKREDAAWSVWKRCRPSTNACCARMTPT